MGFEIYMNFVNSQLYSLFASNIGMFSTMGMNMFRGIAITLLVWYGVKQALTSASGSGGPDLGRFMEFLITLAIGLTMIRYYATPIPGIGQSFYQLIVSESSALAYTIGQTQSLALFDRLNQILGDLQNYSDSLSLLQIQVLLVWTAMLILIGVLELVLIAVTAFGYIALTVLAMIGPVFIPFFIVPKLDFLFWGWFKSFLQYAFYPVIANLYLLVLAKVILSLLDIFPSPSVSFTDTARMIGTFPAFAIIIAAGIWGVLKIPTLVNHLFSGSSGEGGGGLVAATVSAIRGGF